MQKWTWRVIMLLILLLAAGLRLYGNDWDRYEHYHPDERYIAWVATTIEAPHNFADGLNPEKSTFNPYYWPADSVSECIVPIRGEPRDFAYGHLPLYLGVIATRIVERVVPDFQSRLIATCRNTDGVLVANEMDRIAAVGRVLTALFDVGTVLMVYLIGRKLFGPTEAVFAALILSLTVTSIQLAHFFAFDPYMTFFVMLALYFMLRTLQSSRPGLMLALAATATGLAIGSKFSAIMLGLPLLLTWFWAFVTVPKRPRHGLRLFVALVGILTMVVLAFGLTNPFALLDFGCEAYTKPLNFRFWSLQPVNLKSCFLYNIGKQAGMVNGSANFPFTRQYAGTQPYLYFLEMQLRWGMGLLAGLMGIVGLLWIVGRSLWQLRWRNLFKSAERVVRPSFRPMWIILAWCIPFFLTTGKFFVKFMRYWQPLVPFMVLFGVGFIWSWRNRWLKRIAITSVTLFTALYAFSFINIYQQPHPWVTASLWIYDNITPDSTILYESWGDRLPSTLIVDGTKLSSTGYRYQHDNLTWLSGAGAGDNTEKWVSNLQKMADADYIAIDSNRIYGVVPRLPDLYPISSRVYQPLFDGSLGFEAVYVTNRMPHIGRFYLKPDLFTWPDLIPPPIVKAYFDSHAGLTLGRVDESFTLYDQSTVIIFENKGRFSAEKLNEIIVKTIE
ncbi:MAG TPA: phospholipid carrier-dependent glycosyltransferase [Anaerolineae bacterium]|nr:phospholipid carrier-dependent glycosyltransferase [Anaerolineae bacterium]